jgi:hypothetical protein
LINRQPPNSGLNRSWHGHEVECVLGLRHGRRRREKGRTSEQPNSHFFQRVQRFQNIGLPSDSPIRLRL